MPLFLSTYTNKVDKKGRISVPASFRAELVSGDAGGFVAFPHPELKCIEGWDKGRMSRFAEGMDDFSPMSADYAAISTLMSKSRELAFDPEGRVSLSDDLMDWAGISDQVIFAGRGQTFQVWSPAEYDSYEGQVSSLVLANRDNIRLAPRREGGPDA